MIKKIDFNVLYLFALISFWSVLAVNGFPRPYADDTIMIGPSISLLNYGTLDNIFLSKDFYNESSYLFYPPTFSWVLFGWIYLFSTSQISLNLFWAACGVASSYASFMCFRKLTDQNWILIFAPVLIFCMTAFCGFRMEILGFATFFWGLYFISQDKSCYRTFGYFILFVTPTVAPTLLSFSFVVTVTSLFLNLNLTEIGRAFVALVGAAAILFGVTLGDLTGLIHTMQKYSSIRVALGGRADLMYHILAIFALFAPFPIIACSIRVFILKQSIRKHEVFLPLLLVLGFMLALISHARASLQIGFNILAIASFAMAIGEAVNSNATHRFAKFLPALLRRKWLPPLAFSAFLSLLNFEYAVRNSAVHLPSTLTLYAKAAANAARGNKTVVVDSAVAYALDFPTQVRMEDAMVRNAPPEFFGVPTAAKSDELWVVSKSFLLALSDHKAQLIGPNHLEKLFIAYGNPKITHEQICVFDENGSRFLAADFDAAIVRLCRGQ